MRANFASQVWLDKRRRPLLCFNHASHNRHSNLSNSASKHQSCEMALTDVRYPKNQKDNEDTDIEDDDDDDDDDEIDYDEEEEDWDW